LLRRPVKRTNSSPHRIKDNRHAPNVPPRRHRPQCARPIDLHHGRAGADNSGNDDPTVTQPRRLPPPKNGTVFRVVEYPPDSQRVAALRAPDASHDARSEGYVRDLANARHPGFHKTDSIDYAIVLSGEIYALMDEGEVLLKAGDVLIQRGTSHAWSNRTEQPCCVAFVLIDAKPV
jgi:hypothetical protein